FPSVGRAGSVVHIEVRGNFLENSTSAWFDTGAFQTQLEKVDEIKEQTEQRINFFDKTVKSIVYRALIVLSIEQTNPPGVYSLRLISPRGVSNAVHFRVTDEPVAVESSGSHQAIDQAQPVTTPVIITGKLGKPGELTYY